MSELFIIEYKAKKNTSNDLHGNGVEHINVYLTHINLIYLPGI